MSLFKMYLESENEFTKMNDNRLLNTYRKNRDWINKQRQISRRQISRLIESSEESLNDINNLDDDFKSRLEKSRKT